MKIKFCHAGHALIPLLRADASEDCIRGRECVSVAATVECAIASQWLSELPCLTAKLKENPSRLFAIIRIANKPNHRNQGMLLLNTRHFWTSSYDVFQNVNLYLHLLIFMFHLL
jgi:hypothetical protein